MDGTKFTPTNLEVSVQEEMPEKKTTEKDNFDAWPLQRVRDMTRLIRRIVKRAAPGARAAAS